MATETVPAVFDPVKFMADRNALDGKPPQPGQPATKAAAPAPPAANGEDAGDIDDLDEGAQHAAGGTKPPRSLRRTERRQAEEIGFLKGKLAAMEMLIAQGMTPAQAARTSMDERPAKPAVAPEPTREQFGTDTEYAKAWAKWNTAQETGKLKQELKDESQAQTAEQAWHAQAKANQAKFEAESQTFDDWDDAENVFNDLSIPTQEKLDSTLVLFAECEDRAALTYYLFKHPDQAKAWIDLPNEKFVTRFHQLVGTAKALYTPKESTANTAAQAGQTPKTAKPPEKPAQGGQTAAERDLRKARPTSEVNAGRGGSPAPTTPTPGTAEWMAMRNRMEFGK